MEFTFIIEGIDDLETLLDELPKEIDQRKVLRTALREGAKIIQIAAKGKCPVYSGPPRADVKPGELRDSINLRTRTRGGEVTVLIQTGAGDFIGDQFYGAFIEFGHHVGKRRGGGKYRRMINDLRQFVPAHPFLRPAFDENKDAVGRIIGEAIKREVGVILAQHGLAENSSDVEAL